MTDSTRNKKIRKTIYCNYIGKDEQGGFEFGNAENSRYGATEMYFTLCRAPWTPIIGEFHFSRYDSALWDIELAKMKAEGLNGVSTYIFWNHHEVKRGVFDFEDNKDIKKFLSLCKKHDLKVVLRIGPWGHGEARLGGFPDYLRLVAGKRKSTRLYMFFVKRFWSKLYEEVKSFCDGRTVIGIQLENEYGGNISHIYDLRKMAEQIGFKTPFFTMTKWPTDTASKHFLPMNGGYPEAPWTQHRRQLSPGGRFAITPDSNDEEIGVDIIKKKRRKSDFSSFPVAGCEVGVGNQVTSHRRPIINDKDGYGVAFAKLASGMNWLGYYMYHGGRNPSNRPMQESRITLYPNDYPIVDYDFQAPISKDGKVRTHGDRLRLIHIFLNNWDGNFARTQSFFAIEKGMPYISARADEYSGYVFVSNYERGLNSSEMQIDVEIVLDNKTVKVNNLNVHKDAIFFFPVNCNIGDVQFDYITAQPILQKVEKDGLHAYFMKPVGVDVRISLKGEEIVCEEDSLTYENGDNKLVLHFLSEEKALSLRYIDNNIIFSRSCIFKNKEKLIAEVCGCDTITTSQKVSSEIAEDLSGFVSIREIRPIRLKYGYYMFSFGKRKYYSIEVNKGIFDKADDIEVVLDFTGLNMQIFIGNELVDDYFNADGKCVFRLLRLKEKLLKDNKIIIRACAKTRWGIGNPYNEIDMPNGIAEIKICKISAIKYKEVNL